MTQQFAKFINEEMVWFAPKNLKTPSLIAFNFNKNEELMRSKQYYPLVYLEEPTTEEGFYSVPHYQLVENEESPYIAVTFTKEAIEDEGSDD